MGESALSFISFKAPGDPILTADMDTCSEALAQLDDVIMHTFQQCVYHLTKVAQQMMTKSASATPTVKTHETFFMNTV